MESFPSNLSSKSVTITRRNFEMIFDTRLAFDKLLSNHWFYVDKLNSLMSSIKVNKLLLLFRLTSQTA